MKNIEITRNEQNDIIEEDRREAEMEPRTKRTLRRLEEAKALFDVAFKRAVQAVRDAQEELTRPLTRDEILERDEEGF